jgi:hypothetical protein
VFSHTQDGGVEGVDQPEGLNKTLISMEGIGWEGGPFSHWTGELRELISQREVISPWSAWRGSAGEEDCSITGRWSWGSWSVRRRVIRSAGEEGQISQRKGGLISQSELIQWSARSFERGDQPGRGRSGESICEEILLVKRVLTSGEDQFWGDLYYEEARGLIISLGNYCWDKLKEGVIIVRVTMAGTEVNHLMIFPWTSLWAA